MKYQKSDVKEAKIIILAGQSNAVGVGWTKYLSKHFQEKDIQKFKNGYENILINYSSHDITSDVFVRTSVGCTEKTKDTLGPEIGIAKKLTDKYPDEEFFIVKCAFGSTNMYHDWRSPSTGIPYQEELSVDVPSIVKTPSLQFAGWCYSELVKKLSSSIVLLENQGFSPKIIAFCWMQGESDAGNLNTAGSYIHFYDSLLCDLRKIFAAYFSPKCAFIDAGISDKWIDHDKLNLQKKEYAENNNFRYIDTIASGLTTKNEPEESPDTAHYDCYSTIKLGEMFADEIEI